MTTDEWTTSNNIELVLSIAFVIVFILTRVLTHPK
jgi:hypothetical protein